MTIKKLKLIDMFLFMIFACLFHNIYKILPSTLTSLFFPVNESIFEHMKLIIISYVFIFIFDSIIIKLYKLKAKNNLLNLSLVILINISLFLIFYLPIFFSIGENLFVTLLLLFTTNLITEIISFYILTKIKKEVLVLPIIIIIVIFSITTYLTYYPPKNIIFFDTENMYYGLNN